MKHVSSIKQNYNHYKIFQVSYQRFYMESDRYIFLDNMSMWPKLTNNNVRHQAHNFE